MGTRCNIGIDNGDGTATREHIKQVVIGVAFLAAEQLAEGLRAAAHHLDRVMGRPRELTLEQFAAHIGWTPNEFEDWIRDALATLPSGSTWAVHDARGLHVVTELRFGQVAYRIG